MRIRPFYLPALTLLMILLLGTACRKEKSDLQAALYGDWKWEQTTGGIAGTTRTAGSTGETVLLRISPEQRFSVLTNGVLTDEGTFRLYTHRYNTDMETPAIEFSSRPDLPMTIHDVTTDSLILVEIISDGFTHYFTR